MNLVFSFNEGYFGPFKVLLHSIYMSNMDEKFTIYYLHNGLADVYLDELEEIIRDYDYIFYPINCKHFFDENTDVIINRYYTIEMYLWLFAPYVLPDDVERALYLDPDIINLNPIDRFYDLDFEENLFVAMDYDLKTKVIQPLNNLRLGIKDADHYFNTGVVLMNIEKLRKERNSEEIVAAVVDNKAVLILPDQDIFNYLYTGKIKYEDWEYYNCDPRLYQLYRTVKSEFYNKDWVTKNVVFIHYSGKHKPWLEKDKYKNDLGYYYFFYEDLLKMDLRRGRETINE